MALRDIRSVQPHKLDRNRYLQQFSLALASLDRYGEDFDKAKF